MKMKLKLLLWFLPFILLASFVNAAPPFILSGEGDFVEGLQIRFPEVVAISVNEGYDFHFHIFNGTTGMPITEGISCYFHLYNRDGKHIYEEIRTGTDGDLFPFDYEFEVDEGNFTDVGLLYYITQCNSSTSGGFVSSNFAVTPDGRIIIEAQGTIYATVIFVAVMLLLIVLFFAWKLDGENKFTVEGKFLEVNFNKYIKIFLWLMSYQILLFVVFMVLRTAERFLFFPFITILFDWLFTILLVGELPLLILVVVTLFLKTVFDFKVHEWAKRGLKPR